VQSDLITALQRDGVVCLRGVFSEQAIEEFRSAYVDCWSLTKAHAQDPASGPWQRRVFHRMDSKTAPFDKILYHRVPLKQLEEQGIAGGDTVKGQYGEKSVLVRMGRGRYDFTLGMSSTVLATDKVTRPEPVLKVLQHFLGRTSEWISYPGGLPAEGPCSAGRWHRDTYSLWEEDGIADGALPPFYFTMIAPLTRVCEEDGPTQFKLGSHRLSSHAIDDAPMCTTELSPGDAFLFDGRIVHRGGPRTKEAGVRHALYCVHHKWWYTDDDMVPPTTQLEELDPAEVATIEEEEPWLRSPDTKPRWGRTCC